MSNVFHAIGAAKRARCNVRLRIDVSKQRRAGQVAVAQRCGRPGCRARWRDVDLNVNGAADYTFAAPVMERR